MSMRYIRRDWLMLVPYVIFVFFFFVQIAIPVLNDRMDFQFYSDSKTYEYEATDYSKELITVGGNFFGPVMILRLLGPQNYIAIFFFNLIVFFVSLYFFTRDRRLDLKIFLPLILLSSITFTSIMSINKEIISLLFSSILIYNHERKKLKYILFLFVLSYFVRWQLTLFYIVYLLIFSNINFINNRKLMIIVLLVSISIFLFLFGDIFETVFSIYERVKDDYVEGGGSFNLIMNIQSQYGYVLAFPLKTLHLLVGMLSRYRTVFDFTDVYNNLILYLQCILNAIVLYKTFQYRLYRLSYDYFYIAVIYCIIFAITPVYASRYFYPAIIFMSYMIAYESPYKSLKYENSKNYN